MSILIYGIKIGKYFHQFFTLQYPPIMIFSKIGLKSKSGFVWIFFQKTKWTHVSVKNLDGQVSNPKNIATIKVYFSSFPCGTPCMIWRKKSNVKMLILELKMIRFKIDQNCNMFINTKGRGWNDCKEIFFLHILIREQKTTRQLGWQNSGNPEK